MSKPQNSPLVLLVWETDTVIIINRGIEWSLRAFASIRALRFLLRARAMIKFVLRAASTLENTTGKQRALRSPLAAILFLLISHQLFITFIRVPVVVP